MTSPLPPRGHGADRCPFCAAPAGDGSLWRLRSRHRTSRGEVAYCDAACGCLVVLLDGDLVRAVRRAGR